MTNVKINLRDIRIMELNKRSMKSKTKKKYKTR